VFCSIYVFPSVVYSFMAESQVVYYFISSFMYYSFVASSLPPDMYILSCIWMLGMYPSVCGCVYFSFPFSLSYIYFPHLVLCARTYIFAWLLYGLPFRPIVDPILFHFEHPYYLFAWLSYGLPIFVHLDHYIYKLCPTLLPVSNDPVQFF